MKVIGKLKFSLFMSLSQVSVKLITEKGRFRVFNRLLNESNLFAILLILGYLKGSIAADILSICLLPIMVFYSRCRFSQTV